VITAVQPESQLGLTLAGSAASPLASHAAGGAVVRGVVQQRGAQGTVLLNTDLGALSIKTDLTLKRGTELAIKIEQVKDALIARIITIDGKSFAKYQEMQGQGAPSAVMDDIHPSSALTQTVLPTVSATKPPLLMPANMASPQVAGEQVVRGNVVMPAALYSEEALPTSLTATPLRGVLLQPPLLSAPVLATLSPTLQAAIQQAQVGTALQVMVLHVAVPDAAVQEMPIPSPSASQPTGTPTAMPDKGNAVPLPPVSSAIVSSAGSSAATLPSPSTLQPQLPAPPSLPAQPAITSPALPAIPSANTAPSPHMTATVLHQSNPRELTVQTPFGMMKLFTPTALPKGAMITFEVMQLEQVRGGTLTPAMEAHAIPARLQAMEEISELRHVYPTSVPPHLNGHIVPRLGATLASDMLFLLNALQGSGGVQKWLGEALYNQLSGRDEKGTLISALTQDFAALKQLPTELRDGQWHHALIPLYTEGEVRPIQLFFKKNPANARTKQPPLDHFLLEIELTRLGVVQFDGLVQKPAAHTQFDMMVRAAQPWDSEIEKEISRIFYQAQEVTGMVGSVHFYYGESHLLAYPSTAKDAFLVDVADNSLIV
jgi:hypothetical protein